MFFSSVCLRVFGNAVARWRSPQVVVRSLAVFAASLAMASPPAQAQAPSRALSLSPHITELLFAAGAGDRIVGTVSSSDYPDAARKLPRVGDGLNISVESVMVLRPDIVLAWTPSGATRMLGPFLAPMNIPVTYSTPRRLEDIPAEIRRFGQLFGTQSTAEATAVALSERLHTLRERYASRRKLKVFIEIGTSPLYTIGNDPLLNDALDLCGARNLYEHAAIPAPQVSTESVLVNKPDVVITAGRHADRLQEARNRWSALQLPAALKGHVYTIDPDELFRPGPRLVDASEQLCRYLDLAR